MRVLVTGGAGFIGSHTLVSLIESGHEPIVIDNLVNNSADVIDRVSDITGTPITFFEIDARDTDALATLLRDFDCEATIHFAGLKAVAESVDRPLEYYRNNLDSTLSVCEAVLATSTRERPPRIIFSSSATVYGDPQFLPITEEHPVGQNISNPYGHTKHFGEQILKDLCLAHPDAQAIALRYFNPIGAHESGLIGENPKGVPNNLAPYILKVAAGELPYVKIFGDDYDTPDGTGVRDYVHVMDIAEGHVAALKLISRGFHTINLGTGYGTSVVELISAFATASGQTIPTVLLPRREGDVASYFASTNRAQRLLGWSAHRKVDEACADLWSWQQLDPSS